MSEADENDDDQPKIELVRPIGIEEFGEKDIRGTYPPGTTFNLAAGNPVKLDELPDYLVGDDAAPGREP